MIQLNKITTPVGTLTVGDIVVFNNNCFGGIRDRDSSLKTDEQRIYAIYKDDEGRLSFGFDTNGITNIGNTWNYNGTMMGNIKKIIPKIVNNWRERLKP